MSASFVGSSSDSVYGSSSSGVAGSSSALTSSILQSVALAGENVAIAAIPPSIAAPQNVTPPTSPTAVTSTVSNGAWSGTDWLILGVVALVGVFAFREL